MPVQDGAIPKFVAGNSLHSELTASRLNAPLEALDALAGDYNANLPPLDTSDNTYSRPRLGYVTIAASGEPTGNKYNVRLARPKQSLTAGDTVTLEANNAAGLNWTVTATNLGEPFGTHLCPDSLPVLLFSWTVNTAQQQRHWFFIHPINSCIVKVTGNLSGGGKYSGRICTGSSTLIATGDLAMPEGLTVPNDDNAYVANIYETGSSGHELGANTYHMGTIRGVTTAGIAIVFIQSLKLVNCE